MTRRKQGFAPGDRHLSAGGSGRGDRCRHDQDVRPDQRRHRPPRPRGRPHPRARGGPAALCGASRALRTLRTTTSPAPGEGHADHVSPGPVRAGRTCDGECRFDRHASGPKRSRPPGSVVWRRRRNSRGRAASGGAPNPFRRLTPHATLGPATILSHGRRDAGAERLDGSPRPTVSRKPSAQTPAPASGSRPESAGCSGCCRARGTDRNWTRGRPQDVVVAGGIVKPTACACAHRRQGASLRSAPAPRG